MASSPKTAVEGRFRTPFNFTRKGVSGGSYTISVVIEPLNQAEIDRARVNAENYVRGLADAKRVSKQTYADLIDDALTVECLAIALKNPDAPHESWMDASMLRTTLTVTELARLQIAYEKATAS